MPRQPKTRAQLTSANSRALREGHYRVEEAAERGRRDAQGDAQPCELPPPGLATDLQEPWTRGYREEWARKRQEAAQ